MSEPQNTDWQKLDEHSNSIKFIDYIYPKISIIIPTYNHSQLIGRTLDNIFTQIYPDLELIVIDAGSTDRTLEIISSYIDPRLRIVSVTTYEPFEMANKGISLAKGDFINLIMPGDFYLNEKTIKHVMDIALEKDIPDLIYGACLLRDGKSEPKILYRDLSMFYLRKGLQPTALQSCFFRKDLFKVIGKFNISYHIRGGLDLFCRFLLHPGLRFESFQQVVVDYDLQCISRTDVLLHFKETFFIVLRNFGIHYALKWVLLQKDLSRLLTLWWHALKSAILGK